MLSFVPISVFSILPLFIIFPLAIALAIKLVQRVRKLKYPRSVTVAVVALFTAFIVTEFIAIYFSGGFVDYQFFVNLNLHDIIAGLFIFKLQAALAIICFLMFVALLSGLTYFFYQKCAWWTQCLILVIAVSPICYPGGPFSKLGEIYQVISAPKIAFPTALNDLGISQYTTKEQLVADKGKNIVVISLESFEQGFLSQPKVAPNLQQLSQQYTFFNQMPMSVGSSWTTASMYTYMTGMPFLIGGAETTPLVNVEQTQIVSLGDVLSKAGYQTRYVMGSPNFAGMGHIISMFNIPVVSELTYPGRYPLAPFGLYDHDIFDLAKSELNVMRQQQKPFALFISTISTHAPNGFYDKRMEQYVTPQADNMSFVAASLDYNLGQFIDYLDGEGLLDNTVFYIFPDHLMMGAGTETIIRLSQQPRQLYVITNSSEETLQRQTTETLYQMDLPRLILNGAQVKSNALFLSDFLAHNQDKRQFVEQHKPQIATVNRSAAVVFTQNKESE